MKKNRIDLSKEDKKEIIRQYEMLHSKVLYSREHISDKFPYTESNPIVIPIDNTQAPNGNNIRQSQNKNT